MRVLWISFLLFGLAACVPMTKYGSNSDTSSVQPYNPWFSGTAGGGNAQSPGFYQVYSGPSSYKGSAAYNDPEEYAAYSVPYPEVYNAGQFWWDETPNSGSTNVAGQGPTQEQVPEPVFSDVSDLDPVYSISSRTRYQRGNVVFSQTRYIPGEPASFRSVAVPQPVPQPVGEVAAEPQRHVYSYQKVGF